MSVKVVVVKVAPVPVALPGGAAAAAVTTPQVAVFALEEIITEPDAAGAAAAEVFTVPLLIAHALDTVAVPAVVVIDAEPTVPAVVDQDARVPPTLT